ncbi:hypothetical protein RclHR1_01800018 [Rhizophagus clarus]|uniref:Uncharacterized protein n=1 Tax=Rhizophagus clarus TaxID=94130 RepID=A0A2Z6QL68_9GLOM|nr:hypothetical protein RclHR1_01800018 [Rhizophagus clarus]GES89125.1 hypothetical protein GLOIN_2v1558534 [Rhizophagus clarus]
MMFTDRSWDYCFALCVVLLITFQFWYGAPHISFYDDTKEMSKSHLYVGSSSMPAGWTIYMCAKEKTNHMSYNVSVIENSKKAFTRTIFGNASRMPIPTISRSPSGGILSYVLSKTQMENLENNPQIEQVFVEPLMHCLEPVKFCSKNTKQHKLVTDEVQCLAIANPNNYEVRVDFMVNFYVSNAIEENDLDDLLQAQIDDDNKNINYDDNNNNITSSESLQQQKEEQEKIVHKDQEEIIYEKNINTEKQIIIDATHSVFSVILKSGI